MKKLLYFVTAIILSVSTLVSCGDNENFSFPHILTDQEIAQMRYQDSLDSVRRSMINADFIYQYDFNITISANSYDGGFLELNVEQMASDFGITVTELVHGIANMRADYLENGAYADGANITGFAIEGTTHQDNMTAYNTNGIWGHWWDENGDVTAWGDNARIFCEYYEPENEGDPYGFNIGQMPGMLVDGQEIVILECLKYQDKRMALMIKVHAKEREAVVAGVVYEEDITISLSPNDAGSYELTALEFDLNAVCSAIGVSSLSAGNLVAYNSEGNLWTELNADAGFWFDKSGPIGGWGNDASCWISYGMTEPANTIGICLMPNATAAGEHYDHDFGFVNGSKIAMLHVHIDVVAFSDEEEVPAGDPTTVERDITLTKSFDRSYTPIDYDVKDVLKEAFKLTTYQIFQAKNDGSLKVYVDAAKGEDPEYTADVPGYWLDAAGQPCGWGDGVIWLSLGGNETSLYLHGGNHPDNCDPNGQSISTRYVITCNGGTAIFNVKYDIVAFTDPETKPGTTPADATMDVTFAKAYDSDYLSEDIDVRDLVRNTFNLTTYEVQNAIETATMKCYINTIEGDGRGTGGSPVEYWLDGSCAPIDYDGGVLYFGLYADASEGYIMLGGGNHPANCSQTEKTVFTFKYILVYEGTTLTFNVNYTIN